MRDVALGVNLRLLAVRGRGQCHVPVDARTRAGGDPADHAALACRVPALEDHDDACRGSLDPSLQTGKLDLELRELLLEFLALHFAKCRLQPSYVALLLLIFCHLATSTEFREGSISA